MIKRLPALAHEAGFTIIEVMVAIVLLLVAVLGVATMADSANVVSNTSKARVGALNLARELLEDARTFKYSELTGALPAASGGSTDLQTAFSNIGVADDLPSTSGFQIRRRGITYDVNVFTCVFDDAHDGVRAAPASGPDTNANGPYCLGSPTAGSGATTDINPDDSRKVEVSVTWSLYGSTPSCSNANQTISGPNVGSGRSCVTQAELIANPTGGLGPAIISLTQATAGTVEGSTTDHVDMKVTTASPAQSVTFSAPGDTGAASADPTDTDGTKWVFTWNLGTTSPSDGTQIVTAQAFNIAGGVPKRTPVKLNRFIPAVPSGVTGGIDRRLADAAAVSWSPVSDQDVFGYTVYRASGNAPNLTGSPGDTAVCSTTNVNSTLCFDDPGVGNLQSFKSNAACTDATVKAALHECIDYYVVPFDSMWTTIANPAPYTATECPGLPWSPSVAVPAPPVPATRSVAPITNTAVSPLWPTARAGCPSAFVSIDYTALSQNHAPDPPTNGTCTNDAGQPVIGWTQPTSPDQDGDAIVSYRVYRDPPGGGQPNYNDPATTIGFNPGATASYKDSADTGGVGHEYWVAALDARFAESSALHVSWPAGGCP